MRSDLQAGNDHLVLARAGAIDDTERIVQIYAELGPEFAPVAIHSRLSRTERSHRLSKLAKRESRVLVCVNMFGEGFDLPQLKIAAMHSIHKSLPITLQFVGRFTRSAEKVGDASVVVNIADPRVDTELQSLYAENADWNSLLRRRSEKKIEEVVSLQELIESFEGSLPGEVPLWNLRPAMSTLVYHAEDPVWTPANLNDVLPKNEVCWHAHSAEKRTAIAVFAKQEDVRWGRYREIRDWKWHLVLAYWHDDLRLLFLHASDFNALSCPNIARSLVGQSAELISGPRVFRVFRDIERPMVRNLGTSKAGTVRYTMYFGSDVSSGLSQVEKAEATLSNVFGWGYEDGDKVTRGCSVRKGKIWAAMGGPITEWQEWCEAIGSKLNDDTIDEDEITAGFLKPQELEIRPPLVPVAIEWGESLTREQEARVTIRLGQAEYRLSQVSLELAEHSDNGPIPFTISADDQTSRYSVTIGRQSSDSPLFLYEHMGGPEAFVRRGSGEFLPLIERAEWDPLVVMYADGSFSYNQFFVPAACPGMFPVEHLEVIDWDGVNMRKESQGKSREADSVQYRAIAQIIDDFEVIFDDDGSGEAADIVALRYAADDRVVLRLVHCKFSSEDHAGARVDDMYQLCGQAQKSIRWKHDGLRSLALHMRNRQHRWTDTGATRFVKGTSADVKAMEKLTRRTQLLFEVAVVQPGLSKSQVSDPILRLLGSTDLFLKRTADASLMVQCSE